MQLAATMVEEPTKPTDEVETAREDLILIVAGFISTLLTAGTLGAVVWYDLDKLFAIFTMSAVWGAFGIIAYSVKSRLW